MGVFRKLALKLGMARALAAIREIQSGKYGPEAKSRIDSLIANSMYLGWAAGSLVAGFGLYFGQDSQFVGLVTGVITGILLPIGLVPRGWDSAPGSISAARWYMFLRDWSAEIGGVIVVWWDWSTGTGCSAAGGVHVAEMLVIPCGLSTFGCSLVAGFLTHLGLFSSAKLARPPARPITVKG